MEDRGNQSSLFLMGGNLNDGAQDFFTIKHSRK